MALAKCPDCAHDISSEAPYCPYCGRPIAAPRRTRAPGGTAPGSAPNRAARLARGCLVLLIGFAGLGVLIAILEDAPNTSRSLPEVDPVVTRRRDSLQVARLLAKGANLTAAERITADSLIHAAKLPLAHPNLHTQSVDARLGQIERAVSDPARRAFALGQVMALPDPLTHEQAARAQRVKVRLLDAMEKQDRAAALARRREYATQLERTYLQDGKDVHVSVRGTNGTTLHIQWVLVGRPLAYQMGNDEDVIHTLRTLGFKRLELSDGYDEIYWFTF